MKHALGILLVIWLLICACGGEQPTSTPKPTPVAQATATPTIDLPTDTPLPPTDTATPIPSPTATAIPPTDTPTPEPSPTSTSLPVEVLRDIPYVPDGLHVQKLDIYLPTTFGGPFPTLMTIHSGGGHKEEFGYLGQYFAKRGYVVVSINHRDWPDYHYPDTVADAFCALAWVHANTAAYDFEATEIFVLGHSSGANLATMLGVVDNPALYMADCPHKLPETSLQGVIPIAGLFDFVALATDPGVRDYARELFGGDLEELSEIWIEASPVTWVDGSEPPFLLIHGTGDLSIPAGHSEDFAQVLETAGVDVDLLLVPDINHSQIVGHDNTLSAVEAFLERILSRTSRNQ